MKTNNEIKKALVSASTLAVGPTASEVRFWDEVREHLDKGTLRVPEVKPRLTAERKIGTV